MIVGANIAVGAIAAAFWRAALQCALEAREGGCAQGGVALFVEMLVSAEGIIYWAVVAAGLWVFWRGKRMRSDAKGD